MNRITRAGSRLYFSGMKRRVGMTATSEGSRPSGTLSRPLARYGPREPFHRFGRYRVVVSFKRTLRRTSPGHTGDSTPAVGLILGRDARFTTKPTP